MKQIIKTNQYNIGYINDKFKEVFGDIKVSPKKCKMESRILEKSMNDKEILDTFKPQETTLDEFVYCLKEKEGLLAGGYANIFYIKDAKGTLWAVSACWGSVCHGWGVFADSVDGSDGWGGGSQVLSCKFSSSILGDSDSGNLEARVKKLEENMEKIRKFLII